MSSKKGCELLIRTNRRRTLRVWAAEDLNEEFWDKIGSLIKFSDKQSYEEHDMPLGYLFSGMILRLPPYGKALIDEVLIVDCPGSESLELTHGISADEVLIQSSVVMWFIDVSHGGIQKRDLEQLKRMGKQQNKKALVIVLTKTDKKSQKNVDRISERIKDTLENQLTEEEFKRISSNKGKIDIYEFTKKNPECAEEILKNSIRLAKERQHPDSPIKLMKDVEDTVRIFWDFVIEKCKKTKGRKWNERRTRIVKLMRKLKEYK